MIDLFVNRLLDPLAVYEMRAAGGTMVTGLVLGIRRARQLRRYLARRDPLSRGRRSARAVRFGLA